jgi:hypothetical protein
VLLTAFVRVEFGWCYGVSCFCAEYNMVSPTAMSLFYWDAYHNETIHSYNFSVNGCMYPGQSANTINPGDLAVFCDDDYNPATCTFYFAARSGEEGDGYLCKLSVATGTVSPVIPQSTYIPGDVVGFFQTGVVRKAVLCWRVCGVRARVPMCPSASGGDCPRVLQKSHAR